MLWNLILLSFADLVAGKIFNWISVPSVGSVILDVEKKVPTTKAPCFVTETNSEASYFESFTVLCPSLAFTECLGSWTSFCLFSLAVSTLPFATPVLSADEIPEDNERDTSNREWQTNTTNSYVSESRGQAKEESDFQLFLCHFYYHHWRHWANRWQQQTQWDKSKRHPSKAIAGMSWRDMRMRRISGTRLLRLETGFSGNVCGLPKETTF